MSLSIYSATCVFQVLGRRSPFPLILLPQFGGYWIEGTNHELRDPGDYEQIQPLSPTTRTKLECNTTAKIYRRHFLGKVRLRPVLAVECGVCGHAMIVLYL